MTRFFAASCAFFLALSSLPTANAAFVLWSDHYESGAVSDMKLTSGLSTAVVNDPAGGGSKVLQITDTSTMVEWIELRPSYDSSGILKLGAGSPVNYGNLVTFTFDLYLPSPGTAESFTAVLRLKTDQHATAYKDFELEVGLNPTNSANQNKWYRNQTISFLLPETFMSGGNTYTADTLSPILAFRDTSARPEGAGAGGSTGVMVYLDNVHLAITPEPRPAILCLLGTGLLLGLRRRSS